MLEFLAGIVLGILLLRLRKRGRPSPKFRYYFRKVRGRYKRYKRKV